MTPNQERAVQAAFDGYVKLPKVEWRKDAFGHEDCALYLGDLYVGCIMHGAPHRKAWRAWFMSGDDGAEVGWYPTDALARRAVEDRLSAALAQH